MPFSETTNKTGLIQRCEFYTNVGDAGISGNSTLLKQFTALINQEYQKVVTSILNAQDDWDFDDVGTTDGSTFSYSNYPVATTPLVASQRDYTFPVSLKILKIKRVDISYDGTNYRRASPFDSTETSVGIGNDTNLDGNFDKTNPFYDMKGNSIWIYPLASVADVTNSGKIRIEFFREINEFASTDTTRTPGIDTPFHPMLAVGASLQYALAKNLQNKNDLAALYGDYENRLKAYYGTKDEDRKYVFKGTGTSYE